MSTSNQAIKMNPTDGSVLDMLVETVPERDKDGHYDRETQTWSHRSQAVSSPVKFHQEM
jgi:hypothetical protein